MELEIGMYVRTKYGIGKITGFRVGEYLYMDACEMKIHYSEIIGKPSFNPIDLIEIGDYVNGFQVVNKKDNIICVIKLIIPLDLKEEDIKSIVTREQFSAMEYKLGDE